MMYVKIHKSQNSEIVAICDQGLIGKELQSGELFLKISKEFYKGELKNNSDIKKILDNATNVNLVGKECVDIAIELGLVDREDVIMFSDVPYAQVLL